MKQIFNLCRQEEKKLLMLGKQRSQAQQRIDNLVQQQLRLSEMITEYHQGPTGLVSPLLLQNTANLLQTLNPMQKQLTRQTLLVQHEHLRLDGLWRRQLGRQQAISWHYKQRQQQEIDKIDKQEQKQLDDLAARYSLTR